MSEKVSLSLAEEYLAAAETEYTAERYNAAASAAVHAVICANDAMCLALGGNRPRGRSHMEAARALERACRGTRFEEDAAKQARRLGDVMRIKSEAEYGGRFVRAEEAERTLRQARRFVEWVRRVVADAAV